MTKVTLTGSLAVVILLLLVILVVRYSGSWLFSLVTG